jgi:GNAT superfamily N-acetyltransferase
VTEARFTHRIATTSDVEAISQLMASAIEHLQSAYLSAEEICASRAIMGLDTQIIEDGTYFLIECEGRLAGSGGWSRRATLYGGDHSKGVRDARLLDPAIDAARIRAMYTHPSFVRMGVGRMIIRLCEDAAAAEGFTRMQLMATLAGAPLYRACGYSESQRLRSDPVNGISVPLILMKKSLRPARALK